MTKTRRHKEQHTSTLVSLNEEPIVIPISTESDETGDALPIRLQRDVQLERSLPRKIGLGLTHIALTPITMWMASRFGMEWLYLIPLALPFHLSYRFIEAFRYFGEDE